MLDIEITEKVDAQVWNNLVRSVPEGTIFQTTYWADYLVNTGYCKPLFLIARENQKYKGILLFWIELLNTRTRCYRKSFRILEFFSKKLKIKIGNWMFGPLMLDKKESVLVLKKILIEVNKFAKENNLVVIRNLAEPLDYTLRPPDKNVNEAYFSSEYKEKLKATVFLNLSRDIDSMWGGLKKKVREDVNKAKKHHITIGFIEKEELDTYKKLIIENTERVATEFPPYYPDDNMWSALKKEENCLEVIAIKQENKIIGAKGILEFNGIIFQIASCQSNGSYLNKMNVNDLMTWEVIRWGCNNNKRIYDLTGIPESPKNTKEKNLRHYKKKWSDNVIIYNGYERICRKNTGAVINLLKKLI